jgi:hypothetical protein
MLLDSAGAWLRTQAHLRVNPAGVHPAEHGQKTAASSQHMHADLHTTVHSRAETRILFLSALRAVQGAHLGAAGWQFAAILNVPALAGLMHASMWLVAQLQTTCADEAHPRRVSYTRLSVTHEQSAALQDESCWHA